MPESRLANVGADNPAPSGRAGHDVRMTRRRLRLAARWGALPLVLSLTLAGCAGGGDSGDDKSDDAASDETSTSATTEPTAEETTEEPVGPGSEVKYGEAAPLTWKPNRKIEGSVEVVVRKVRQAPISDFEPFKLDEGTRASTPYYVTVKATNTGTSNPGGFELPLYLDNGSDVLFPAAKFNAEFPPCANRLLPKKFKPGNTAQLCLVFLAAKGTTLEAVAMRPNEDTEPVLWSGKIVKPGQGKGKKSS